MRRILETEEHVQVPPAVYSDPFYRISYLMKEEIRKYKWFEGEKGRPLSWKQARKEWTEAHREKYLKFLFATLSFPEPISSEDRSEEKEYAAGKVSMMAKIPFRAGG
jgi:hypothetical protein